MATPTILFHSGTGSDTAASGAGPATALTGSAASYSGTVVTLDGSPDLSGVAVDGSHVLYLATSTGRRFFAITAKDNTAKTVTVAANPAGTASGLAWALGGRRATFAHANSRLLFTADALPGWTIQTATDQTGLATALDCTVSGSTAGLITLQGDSRTTRRLLSSATNNVSLLAGGLTYWAVRNFKFTSTAATKTFSHGIDFNTTNSSFPTLVENCVFGDPTDKLRCGIQRTSTAQPWLTVLGCEFQYCLDYGLDNGGGAASGFQAYFNRVHHCTGRGIVVQFNAADSINLIGNTVYANGGIGIEFVDSGGNAIAAARVIGNTVHGNGSDGLKIGNVNQLTGAVVLNNQFTGNTGKGLNYTGAVGDLVRFLTDYNNFGSGATVNAGGALAGLTGGPHDLAVDPGYANAAAGDFTPSAAAAQAAYPGPYGWIGAVQPQATTGTAGGFRRITMDGGF